MIYVDNKTMMTMMIMITKIIMTVIIAMQTYPFQTKKTFTITTIFYGQSTPSKPMGH